MSTTDKPALASFSLIELLVIFAIILLLVGLFLPSIEKARSSYNSNQTRWNMRSIGLACLSANVMHKTLPPAFDKFGKMTFPASVHVHLLPYMEQDDLYANYLRAEGKGAALSGLVPGFASPQDRTCRQDPAGVQNSAANLRVFSTKGLNTSYNTDMPILAGIEPGTASLSASFPDGLSNTILFATKFARCGDGGSRYAAAPDSSCAAFFGQNAAQTTAHPSDPTATFQLNPSDENCRPSPLMAQSFAPDPGTDGKDGLMVGLGDGSCRYLSPGISPETWNRAMQPNDGKALGEDWN